MQKAQSTIISPMLARHGKEDCVSSATTAFADTDVKITSEGRPYLGAAIGMG